MNPAPMSSRPTDGVASSLLSGAATAGGLAVPVSLSLFVDTWVSAPPRIIAPRDFTFKAVIGEPDW